MADLARKAREERAGFRSKESDGFDQFLGEAKKASSSKGKWYFVKMDSLYQIGSKMLHGTKLIILVEKNRKRGSLAGIQTHDLHIRRREC